MLIANPENEIISEKPQTIEEYINETLQLKTLKIKKFSFADTFSCEINSSRKFKNSFTQREPLDESYQKCSNKMNGWEPKLSYRKLMKEPKILLSVERRKIKTSQSIRKANEVFSAPKTRIGFRGEKVRCQSFFVQKSEQKAPKKLVIQTNNHYASQKKHKPILNFHFNFKYVIEQRKKGKNNLTVEEMTKKGSNNGYFAFFGSENFTKYLESNFLFIEENSYHPNSSRLHAKTKQPALKKPISLIQEKQ